MKDKTATMTAVPLLMTAAAMLLFWSCTTARLPDLGAPQLSEAERADLAYVRRTTDNLGERRFDFSDDRDYRFFMKRMQLAGFSKEKSPQLFRSIEALRAADLAAGQATGCPSIPIDDADFSYTPSVQLISGVETTDDRNWNSAAFSAVADNPPTTALTLGLYNDQDQHIGNVAQVNSNEGQGYYPIQATGFSNSSEVYAYYTYFFLHNGTPCSGGLKREVGQQLPTLVNQQPTSPVGGTPVTICVNRSPNADNGCTYGEQVNSQTIEIPVQGSAAYLTALDVNSQGKPVSPQLSLSMTNTTNGGGCVAFGPNALAFFDNPNTTISDNNTKVSWDIATGDLVTKTECLNLGDILIYNFVMTLQMQSGTPETVIVTSSQQIPQASNVVWVGQFKVFNGCLAKGSRIELADGALKPIEDLIGPEDRVRTGNGVVLSVAGQTSGREAEMIYIRDDQGHELLLSEGHPVVTRNRGPLLAKELQVGEVVVTRNGYGSLVEVERRRFDQEIDVFNLDLGYGDEMTSDDSTTMFANGILVGDGNMQRTYGERHRLRPENVLDRLPQEWHEDYRNTEEFKSKNR